MFQLNNFPVACLIVIEIGFARSLVLVFVKHSVCGIIAVTASVANILDELPYEVTTSLYELIEDVLLKTDTIDVVRVKLPPLV
jgi:hypothetical protein